IVLKDSSSNGTLVNGKIHRCCGSESLGLELKHDDIFSIANHSFRVEYPSQIDVKQYVAQNPCAHTLSATCFFEGEALSEENTVPSKEAMAAAKATPRRPQTANSLVTTANPETCASPCRGEKSPSLPSNDAKDWSPTPIAAPAEFVDPENPFDVTALSVVQPNGSPVHSRSSHSTPRKRQLHSAAPKSVPPNAKLAQELQHKRFRADDLNLESTSATTQQVDLLDDLSLMDSNQCLVPVKSAVIVQTESSKNASSDGSDTEAFKDVESEETERPPEIKTYPQELEAEKMQGTQEASKEASFSLESARKKIVTFGRPLSPEIFHSENPAATPVQRGSKASAGTETPRNSAPLLKSALRKSATAIKAARAAPLYSSPASPSKPSPLVRTPTAAPNVAWDRKHHYSTAATGCRTPSLVAGKINASYVGPATASRVHNLSAQLRFDRLSPRKVGQALRQAFNFAPPKPFPAFAELSTGERVLEAAQGMLDDPDESSNQDDVHGDEASPHLVKVAIASTMAEEVYTVQEIPESTERITRAVEQTDGQSDIIFNNTVDDGNPFAPHADCSSTRDYDSDAENKEPDVADESSKPDMLSAERPESQEKGAALSQPVDEENKEIVAYDENVQLNGVAANPSETSPTKPVLAVNSVDENIEKPESNNDPSIPGAIDISYIGTAAKDVERSPSKISPVVEILDSNSQDAQSSDLVPDSIEFFEGCKAEKIKKGPKRKGRKVLSKKCTKDQETVQNYDIAVETPEIDYSVGNDGGPPAATETRHAEDSCGELEIAECTESEHIDPRAMRASRKRKIDIVATDGEKSARIRRGRAMHQPKEVVPPATEGNFIANELVLTRPTCDDSCDGSQSTQEETKDKARRSTRATRSAHSTARDNVEAVICMPLAEVKNAEARVNEKIIKSKNLSPAKIDSQDCEMVNSSENIVPVKHRGRKKNGTKNCNDLDIPDPPSEDQKKASGGKEKLKNISICDEKAKDTDERPKRISKREKESATATVAPQIEKIAIAVVAETERATRSRRGAGLSLSDGTVIHEGDGVVQTRKKKGTGPGRRLEFPSTVEDISPKLTLEVPTVDVKAKGRGRRTKAAATASENESPADLGKQKAKVVQRTANTDMELSKSMEHGSMRVTRSPENTDNLFVMPVSTVLAYIAVAATLLFLLPLVSFALWRDLLDPAARASRRRPTIVTPFHLSAVIFRVCRFLSPPQGAGRKQRQEPDPRLCSAAAEFVANDAPWIFRLLLLSLAADTACHLLLHDISVQFRLYILAACCIGIFMGLTERLRAVYIVFSTGRSAGGRVLGSATSTRSEAKEIVREAAKSRLVRPRQESGDNIFGMAELRTEEQNRAMKRKLERKTPEGGLDALLGLGLKHGAGGVAGRVDKFQGRGRRLENRAWPENSSYEKID
ncbi:hypothetical protein HDU82_009195, partial [Entophlyctis luteolus]